jgi:hydroxylamine reductase (hybrid-cluster protein)
MREINLKTMELLETPPHGSYGHPVPTAVPWGKERESILVSGHDLKDWMTPANRPPERDQRYIIERCSPLTYRG